MLVVAECDKTPERMEDDSMEEGSTDSVSERMDPRVTKAKLDAVDARIAELEAALAQAKRDREVCALEHKLAHAKQRADKLVVPKERKPPCKVKDCPDSSKEHRMQYYHAKPTPAETRKPCVYFSQGKCNKGDGCKFSHDATAPAAPVPGSIECKNKGKDGCPGLPFVPKAAGKVFCPTCAQAHFEKTSGKK